MQGDVRTFFVQSFQMRMLQQEFIALQDNLKQSLQQQVKFEITERIISDSRFMYFFRLFMIKDYGRQREELAAQNPYSTRLEDFQPQKISAEYKKILFSLINKMEMAHHSPGQQVMKQNASIFDENGDYLTEDESNHVFFIMTGYYVVLTQQFDFMHKFTSLTENDRSCKALRSGDIFGEVSVLFSCPRTATIKAKQYCEAAYIKNEDFMQLLVSHNILKSYLTQKSLRDYDDEQRIFLISVLK